MDILIWIGAFVSVLGLAGLIWCIATVWKARKNARDDAELRAALQRVVPVNTCALFLSFTGLMMVVVGMLLG